MYSSVDGIDRANLAARFRPIEWAFNTPIVYGTRRYDNPGEKRTGEAEVLLVDVSNISQERLSVFKLRLWERFGLESGRYDDSWEYEEYVRLAEPAYYALLALLESQGLPCILFSHEFMGMPAALQAIMDGGPMFRTIFHAHECAPARKLVEDHPGHDTMFYNVMRQAKKDGRYVEEVFGDLSHVFRHALVGRAHLCDGVVAVGDMTREELQFLNKPSAEHDVSLVYNGLPAMKVDLKSKLASRRMLLDYSKQLVGYKPDYMITHVTRPVISKGIWRDLKVCHELDQKLQKKGKTAVFYLLTTAAGPRCPQDVSRMEREYGWPRHHREGYPDLVGPEVDLGKLFEAFNQHHDAVQVVLVNQFGWTAPKIGSLCPPKMDIADLRRAADAEFGMATYEPFGISPLEPLGSGAVCVISNVCGCSGFVNHVAGKNGTPNVLVADYTQLDEDQSIDELLAMTQEDRDPVEQAIAKDVAKELLKRLPENDKQREALIKSGQALVAKMGWDQVLSESLLPLLDQIMTKPAAREHQPTP